MKHTRHNPGKYSTPEIELLKSDLGDYEVAEKIGRSPEAVHIKRERMRAARKLVDFLELVRVPDCKHEYEGKFIPHLGRQFQCLKCGFEPYTIGKNGSFIICNKCGLKSHSHMDVKYMFCASCKG